MYKPIKGGSFVEIQGLKCQLPPVGKVYNLLTGALEDREIIKRSTKKENQYWQREEIPDWYKKATKEAIKKRKLDPEYFDEKCDEYESQEWDRRLNGAWFMNNGKPTYITGDHYMYLQWWKIDIGYPHYWEVDREYFYFLKYCIDDPICLGMDNVTQRRSGKSYKAGLFIYEYVARSEETNGGIQSKTETDARKMFTKTIVWPFKKLPSFFRPEYDKAQGDTPKKSIDFQATSKRGSKIDFEEEKEELNSHIDFASASEYAYDGSKIHRYVADECGKTAEVNVYDRHNVVKPCLKDPAGRIIGKALYTTTVEKLETDRVGISEAFRELWRDSDQNNRGADGSTVSGLYRFFTPATRYRVVDKYGVSDEKRGLELIMAARKTLENNPRALAQEIRKYPLSIEEAFRFDEDKCIYNSIKLNDQRDYLSWNDDIIEKGNLIWADKDKTRVVWEKNRHGRWQMPRGFILNPDETNITEKKGSLWYPRNNWKFGSGVDPYDHDTTQDKYKRSNGASIVKQKSSLMDETDPFANAYVCRYKFRPQTAPLFYEDMIKQCHYFGCSVLFENNKPGIKRYFIGRGYEPFLMKLKGYSEPGVPSTEGNKQDASEMLELMIEENSDKLYFIDQIEDFLQFDIRDTRKYDLTMATLWTEVACANTAYLRKERELTEVEDLFRKIA
ncbi:hypothetical protein GCM10027051_31240 [Niabella terrae]